MVQRTTYLLCGSTHKRLHLCQSLLARLVHGGDQGTRRGFREDHHVRLLDQGQPAEQARATGETGRAGRPFRDDLDQTTREIGKMHDDITAAFRALIEDGIIDPGRFRRVPRLGIPPKIAAMVGERAPMRHLCG